ncbi:MAG: hypothetical protein O7198_00380 [Wolbachia endosymbiont of Nomada marshamella]|nr:hypothetical protein [Wolbachia endosymbiont of Nomada marshamella]
MYSKTNAPYLIAGAFATLVLLASGTLAVAPYVAFLSPIAAFNVALPVALSLSILSTLILALSCKMISNNKKIEVEKNKFAEKEQELESVKQQFESKVQELENKITLEKEAKEAASKEVEELNNQLNELTREKQGLESEIERLNEEIEWLKKQLESQEELYDESGEELYDESEGKGGDENKNEELEKKITKEIEDLKASLNMTSRNIGLHKQNKKHSSENSNIDKTLFNKALKAEKKFNENINKYEETLSMLERISLQENAVQEATNSLEMIKDLSSKHSSEFEGTGENKLANGLTFPKPLSPRTSTPRRYSRKSLSPKKEDEDENKENSEQLNHENPNTSTGSPNLSLFRDATNNSYHTLTM